MGDIYMYLGIAVIAANFGFLCNTIAKTTRLYIMKYYNIYDAWNNKRVA